jgi:hypothetical protein
VSARLVVALLVSMVIGLGPAATASAAPTAGQANRATADLPDQQIGPQIHFVYAVPADGTDRGLDQSGEINGWATTFNDWLASQTGGVRLRIDTSNGAADVTFVQVPETEMQLNAMGFAATGQIANDVFAHLPQDPNKKYVIVYEGSNNFGFCGHAINVSVVYLNSCNFSDWLAMLIGHEVFHLLGAVDTCAPHSAPFEETGDDPRDLMAFDVPFIADALLDPGHDDYWGPPGDNHLPTACPPGANVANSDYLTSHPFVSFTVAALAGGSVDVQTPETEFTCSSGAPCTAAYPVGSKVTLSPDPDNGYRFVGWNGGGCASSRICVTSTDTSTTVLAQFAPDPLLTIRIRGSGRVQLAGLGETCKRSLCRFQVPYNKATSLKAVAGSRAHWTKWAGACHGKLPRCVIRVTAAAAVTATFDRLKHVQ